MYLARREQVPEQLTLAGSLEGLFGLPGASKVIGEDYVFSPHGGNNQ